MKLVAANAAPEAPEADAVEPAAPKRERAAPGRNGATTGDLISELGLPDAELTPRVRVVVATLIEEVGRLRASLSKAEARAASLASLADTDPLLGVLNRRAFVAELARTQALAQRYGEEAALAFFDVDDMKFVNDAYGHCAGDAALQHVARVIGGAVRKSDVFARLGGDEFAAILRRASPADARRRVDDLAGRVAAAPLAFNGHEIAVAVSGGVAQIDPRAAPATLLAAADAKMYAAKAARRQARLGVGLR